MASAELADVEEDEEDDSFAMEGLLLQNMVALIRSDLPPPLQKHQDSPRTRILSLSQIGVLNDNEEGKGV